MCGIAGISFNNVNRPDEGLLKRMCSVIRHRGPDDMGIWEAEGVGIGMTRLSIQDLAGGHQPIHNENKTIWIVFNGEIYNFPELRDGLEKKGHRFSTRTDTEVIVHLYEEYGDRCVEHLRGMFGFAIWDEPKKRLLLARDRLGIKPLFYCPGDGFLVFGSELKSLLQYNKVRREVNHKSLVDYFFYGYVPDPDTMFQGCFKLPPGHLLTYCKGKAQVRQYWDVEYRADEGRSEDYYVEKLLEILDESVRMHMISDVPLGAFLSGGTDSSLVVGLMSKLSGKPIKTFSIGFDKESHNELPHARVVAKTFSTEHHEQIVKPEAGSIILDLVRNFDEPFADSSALPTYYVSKLAREHVKVVLTGDGGDELFGGYTHYLKSPLTRHTDWLPGAVKKGILLNLGRLLPDWSPGVATLRGLSCIGNEQLINKYTKGFLTVHDQVFSAELAERAGSTDPSAAFEKHLNKMDGRDELTKLQYLDTKTYLPGDILTKVDRASMMVSLEARVPILDHKLVEFAASVPPSLKVRGNTTKYILKKAAEKLVPKEVIYRPKQGFAIPIGSWLRNEWSGMCTDLVLGERALSRNNFNPRFLNKVMTEHKWGRRDHSYIIWTLMVLELWFREMIDRR